MTGNGGEGRQDRGSVTAFTAIIVVGLLACAGLVLDGGLQLAAKVSAVDDAQEAARTGAQQLDLAAYRGTGTVRLMPDQAAAAARSYLAGKGYTSTVTISGDTVTVRVAATRPTQLLGLIGVGSLHVTGSATAQALHGIDGPG